MSASILFTKMHGAGNDFVLIDGRQHHWPELSNQAVALMADRRFGIGFDQLLWLLPPKDEQCYAAYRIFNADGSEVSQCGNGLRCMGRYLTEHDKDCPSTFTLHNGNQKRLLKLSDHGVIAVNVGCPHFNTHHFPNTDHLHGTDHRLTVCGQSVTYYPLALDNPHIVIKTNRLPELNLELWGPALAYHDGFPEGSNVHFAGLDANGVIATRTYERGVGETLACGTGACSAALAMHHWHGLLPPMQVRQKGGILSVDWDSLSQGLWLTGPTAFVFSGEYLLSRQIGATALVDEIVYNSC
jgi:diaminopimelate epimerase